MKSKTHLSAKITASEVMEVLEENGYSDAMALYCLFFKNVAKEVFNINL